MSNTGDQQPYYMFNIQDKIVYTLEFRPHPQRVDFTLSGPWTKFGHNKVVHQYNIRNVKLKKNQVGIGFVRSVICEHPTHSIDFIIHNLTK